MEPSFKYGGSGMLCFFIVIQAMAQESLVRNGSFEELRDTTSTYPCPTSGGQVFKAKYWGNAEGTCDYFNACSNEDWPDFGVPNNRMGFQDAFEDDAYALLGCYSTHWENAREYLWQELEQPLRTGQGYFLSFRISLADSVNFAVSNIGVLFTEDDTKFWSKAELLAATANVESAEGVLLDDKSNWMTVSGQFVAAGGEMFLTIGTFRQDDEMVIGRVSSHPEATYNWETNGYYIDGVELYEDNSIGIVEQESMQSVIYPNPSDGDMNLNYQCDGVRVVQWEVTDMAGRAVHVQYLQGNRGNAVLRANLPSGVYMSTIIADGVRMGGSRLVVL